MKEPRIGEFFCKWAISLSKQDLDGVWSLHKAALAHLASQFPFPAGCSLTKRLEILCARFL